MENIKAIIENLKHERDRRVKERDRLHIRIEAVESLVDIHTKEIELNQKKLLELGKLEELKKIIVDDYTKNNRM